MNTKTAVSGLGAFLAATLVTIGTIVGSARRTSTTTASRTYQQPSSSDPGTPACEGGLTFRRGRRGRGAWRTLGAASLAGGVE